MPPSKSLIVLVVLMEVHRNHRRQTIQEEQNFIKMMDFDLNLSNH